jgi:hypothetical protein
VVKPPWIATEGERRKGHRCWNGLGPCRGLLSRPFPFAPQPQALKRVTRRNPSASRVPRGGRLGMVRIAVALLHEASVYILRIQTPEDLEWSPR